MKLILMLLAAISAASLHDMNASPKGFGGAVDLTARNWFGTTQGNGGKNWTLVNDKLNGALLWQFPTGPNDPSGVFLNYVVTDISANGKGATALSGTLHLKIKVDTLGTPVFGFQCCSNTTGTLAVHMRPFISTGAWDGPDGTRWWSNPIAFTMQDSKLIAIDPIIGAFGVFNNPDGTIDIDVPIADPAYWNGVFGEHANDSPTTLGWFANTVSHASYVGVCFGGGDAFCHGATITQGSGTASVEIKEFWIR